MSLWWFVLVVFHVARWRGPRVVSHDAMVNQRRVEVVCLGQGFCAMLVVDTVIGIGTQSFEPVLFIKSPRVDSRRLARV